MMQHGSNVSLFNTIKPNESPMKVAITETLDEIKRWRNPQRPKLKMQFKKPDSDDDDDNLDAFTAKPTDDIPKNKLTEKLARGLQSYIQRMQKRIGMQIEISKGTVDKLNPAPREGATLTAMGMKGYLIGGLNYDAVRDIYKAQLINNDVKWTKVQYSIEEKIIGRTCHSSVPYNDKIFTFGGCFMFNHKRAVRECTSQVLVFDSNAKTMKVLQTKGISVQARKNHSATAYMQSMVIYGGSSESGLLLNEMICLDLENHDWIRLPFKSNVQAFHQGSCVSVILSRQQAQRQANDHTRKVSGSHLF